MTLGMEADQELQLDRNAIASSRLSGLRNDLGLHGTQYSTCISILFVGQVTSIIRAREAWLTGVGIRSCRSHPTC
jgi:hypothetical protein